nr:phosphorylase b - rabbit (fragments) [Oryctolagus cuniculus]
ISVGLAGVENVT